MSTSISTGTSIDMTLNPQRKIIFARLPDISPNEILTHMSDNRVAQHMPLLTFEWNRKTVAEFVAAKEKCWHRDGLGHWAILSNDTYVGWGGFQKEGNEWDYGLVLKPEFFGLGIVISKKAIEFAIADERISYVTFLLPPSRKNLSGLSRFGASFVEEIEYDGAQFLKYRLDTE